MHRCCTILLPLFFIINVSTSLVSMELPLVDFKHRCKAALIKECKKYGFNYDEQPTTNDAISHIFNITKQLNKNKNDQEIYDIIKKRIHHFVAQQLAFHYMSTQGIANETLSQIAMYVYEDFALPPLLKNTFANPNKYVDMKALAISAEGKTLYAGMGDNITVLNTATMTEQATLCDHTATVRDLILNKKGNALYSASDDGTVKVWNLTTGKVETTFEGHEHTVHTLVLSPDEKTLYSASYDGNIKAWNLLTKKEEGTLVTYPSELYALAINPDGTLLYTGFTSEVDIRVWDIPGKKELSPLVGHESFVIALAISPDGKTLYSGETDNTIKIWDLTIGQVEGVIRKHTNMVRALALSSDGNTLCSGASDNTIKIWDLVSEKEQATLCEHTDELYAIIISPDDTTLYSSSNDETITAWDLHTNVPILRSNNWRLALYKSFLVNNES